MVREGQHEVMSGGLVGTHTRSLLTASGGVDRVVDGHVVIAYGADKNILEHELA